MYACFHVPGVQCDNCRTGLVETAQRSFIGPTIILLREDYDQLILERERNKSLVADLLKIVRMVARLTVLRATSDEDFLSNFRVHLKEEQFDELMKICLDVRDKT